MKTLTYEQMENTQGGMPCWAATAILIGAGISLTFFTGGIAALALNLGGVFGGGWGYIEACFPKLMES
jgi:hypothetical protein